MTILAKPIYIQSFSHRCGDWIPIEEMQDAIDNQAAIHQLSRLGIQRFSKLQTSLNALITENLERSLGQAKLSADDIDATIFFSTTLDPYIQHSDVPMALHDLGITRAIPYGVFYNQCTNHTQALQLAQLLCAEGRANHIAVFGYDALDDNKISRILPSRTSVYSDAFISCIVSREVRKDSYRIDSIDHLYAPEISQYNRPEDALHFITAYSRRFSEICQQSYKNNLTSSNEYNFLITPNYNFSVVKNLAEIAGFPEDRVYRDNITRYSHCFSGDHFIALQHLEKANKTQQGNRYLLTAVGGFVTFSAVTLMRV